jgi:hypothetical protein
MAPRRWQHKQSTRDHVEPIVTLICDKPVNQMLPEAGKPQQIRRAIR